MTSVLSIIGFLLTVAFLTGGALALCEHVFGRIVLRIKLVIARYSHRQRQADIVRYEAYRRAQQDLTSRRMR